MLIHRNLKASVRAWLQNLFENPPAADQASGIDPYNVYGESQMRDTTHADVSPFIYLVDSRTLLYEALKMPCLVLEMETIASTFLEMGNSQRGHYCEVAISIYARNRGERDDLASFIEKNLTVISINDYSGSTPTLLETVAIEPGVGVADVRVTGSVAGEGTLGDWVVVSFAFASWN